MNTEQTLTFAEAMALDPSQVEARRYSETGWRQHDDWQFWNHKTLSKANFRRARPKRSRVQEMYQQWLDGQPSNGDKLAAEVIRAVCEYMRGKRWVHTTADEVAADIEREFLEPR